MAGTRADGADIDDPPMDAPVDHVLADLLIEHKGGAPVDIELIVEFFAGDLPERLADTHSGIVDEDIEARRVVQSGCRQPLGVIQIGQIGRNAKGVAPEVVQCLDRGVDRIGLTAGASTPDYSIDEVEARLRELLPA